jgi:hypothetical protein
VSALMEGLITRVLTETPQSFNEVLLGMPNSPDTNHPYTQAPIRTALGKMHSKGEADYIMGRSLINNQKCKLWFKCDEVVAQPKVASTLFQVAMSRPWDINVFAQV